MKRPVEPQKPWPPYKPTAPTKRIVQARVLGTVEIDKYGSYSFESFHQMMMTACEKSDIASIEQEKIKFSMTVDNEHSYYDEVIPHINMTIYVDEEIDNPHYESSKKQYDKQMKKYEADNEAFKKGLAKYKLDKAKYDEDNEAWLLEFHKTQAAMLEKKKSKKGKV
jgi:hypothetical protein